MAGLMGRTGITGIHKFSFGTGQREAVGVDKRSLHS
jgi:hypothetical protein